MKIPKTIGIIMDGNRRWAREHNLSTLEGHKHGYEKIKELLGWAKDAGVGNVVVFAFSTENWNRSEEEVGYLMKLLRTVLASEVEEIRKQGGRLRFAGERARFAPDIQEAMNKAEEATANGTITLWLCLSYGGRAEIVNAIQAIVKKGVPAEAVSEETVASELWTAGMPDPDIIIRTSGEQRLSGFLPWQGVYSELFFVKTFWPAFSKEEFESILKEYDERERRFGK